MDRKKGIALLRVLNGELCGVHYRKVLDLPVFYVLATFLSAVTAVTSILAAQFCAQLMMDLTEEARNEGHCSSLEWIHQKQSHANASLTDSIL